MSKFKKWQKAVFVRAIHTHSSDCAKIGESFDVQHTYYSNYLNREMIMGPHGESYFEEELATEKEFNSPLYEELK